MIGAVSLSFVSESECLCGIQEPPSLQDLFLSTLFCPAREAANPLPVHSRFDEIDWTKFGKERSTGDPSNPLLDLSHNERIDWVEVETWQLAG